ncbi:MAG: uracil-DNA glycosylase [Betaproteobacteria bacterium]
MATRHEVLRELGLAPLWVRKTTPGDVRASATAASAVAKSTATVAEDRDAAARLTHIAGLSLAELHADVVTCTACRLCRTRKLAVPGVGDPLADWLFIGEAPGAEEDARGEPFVGQAGRLLDNMLAALGLSRERQVYIANVLKCRPPNNRAPEPAETQACQPYLLRQIELIAPRIIIALGKSAATLLLGDESSIASLRGRVHRFRDVPLVVTYHPAYLLRSLPEKAKAWEDLLLAKRTVAGQ